MTTVGNPTNNPFPKSIVVGASSGIGAEIVRQLARQGAKVVAVARRGERLRALAEEFPGQIHVLIHDVRDGASVAEAFLEATQHLAGLDLLVYAAGVMPEVGWHEYNLDKDQAMVDVNVSGAVAWINQAAQRMENTRHGSIVAIGSVAGDRGRGGQPVYNATKAFLATYMEAIRNRVARYGVKVVTVKPGPVQTEMTAHLGLKNAMPVQTAAAKILALANRTGEHYLSPVHRAIFYIIKRFPSPLFRKLKV